MGKFYTQTVHSDILIHWTGKDFDPDVKDDFYSNEALRKPSIIADDNLVNKYITRLRDILKFGLWVVDNNENIGINGRDFNLIKHPRACFTELKLSESRKHAFRYGRLGIGLKRLFVVKRGGHPVQYLHHQGRSLFFPPYVEEAEILKTKYAFFKRMNSSSDLNYDLFAESEWRTVYDPVLCVDDFYINPRGDLEKEFNKYSYKDFLDIEEFKDFCQRNTDNPQLKFFLPLDGWLAMIVYPTPQVKNIAYKEGVQDLVANIKSKNSKKISPLYEQNMMPVELDLDLCDHF